MYDFLKEVDAKQIILEQDLHTPQEKIGGASSFGPLQEPYRSEQTFINVPYIDLAMNPWSVDIPLMIGGCSEEGFFLWRAFKAFAGFFSSPPGIGTLVGEKVLSAKPDSVQNIIKFYYGDSGPSVENMLPIVLMWGDRYFWQGVHAAIGARLKKGGSGKTFVYRFAAKSKLLVDIQVMFAGEPVDGKRLIYYFSPLNNVLLYV